MQLQVTYTMADPVLEYYLSSILQKDYQKSLKVLFMGEIYRLVSKVYSHLVI